MPIADVCSPTRYPVKKLLDRDRCIQSVVFHHHQKIVGAVVKHLFARGEKPDDNHGTSDAVSGRDIKPSIEHEVFPG